jgi:ABC-type antimicrobial peptide transport system permease subunit
MPALQRTVRELDTAAPLSALSSMDDRIADSLQRPRSLSVLIALFAFVALILSIVGIYGVMGYYVQQQRREIGIRMALGGSASAVARLVLGNGMQVATVGVVAGIVLAFALTRWMSSLLFGVGSKDASTFVAVSAGLLTIAFATCLLPARRATAVEPASVLRSE